MDIIDIIPTYERLLREAAISSLEVDDFDLDNTNPESAAKFAELEKTANVASLALLNFYFDEGNMLRLLLGSQLAKTSKEALAKMSREEAQKALQSEQKTN